MLNEVQFLMITVLLMYLLHVQNWTKLYLFFTRIIIVETDAQTLRQTGFQRKYDFQTLL